VEDIPDVIVEKGIKGGFFVTDVKKGADHISRQERKVMEERVTRAQGCPT